ncbi:uncharacterized protein G2W53_016354 [Senna tora]|uniref:Uncharacterized protein n=1 Tax=Senna tora TaxID=362788 RepID=A0A834TRC9_9FABA|nr:uncharacterized protein G2W53_016354 [Senna tora]
MHPWKSPLWATCGPSDRCTLGIIPTIETIGYGGSCRPLLSSLARAEVASTYVLIAWQLVRSSIFILPLEGLPILIVQNFVLPFKGIIILPRNRRIFHSFLLAKGLPIDEGILRPSLLGNFPSLSSAEGSFILPLGGGIFLPSLWRDRSSRLAFFLVIPQLAPLEGSIVRSPS